MALPELPSGARMSRRLALLHCATLAALPSLAWAQTARPATTARPARLAPQLRIVIPANPGGGWDQTGRALGASLLQAGLAEQIDYENVGGKGGTLGLAHFADKYSGDSNALLVGGMVMVGAVALQKPRVDLSHVRPVARLTSDYLVVVVPAQSPIKSTRDLVAALRQDLKSVPIAGGSAGGVDHMFAGVLVRAAKAAPDALVYRPHASGADVVAALLKGDAVVGISGYSEVSEALGQGTLRAIGVSARRPVFGLPTFRDQGLDAEMANWRGVFAGRDIPAARVAEWAGALEYTAAQEPWQKALHKNRWESAWLTGKDLSEFIELSQTTASVMAYLLKLKS
ncbi:Bug family tripartite tricarboxylate transporter substrate binding protein [Acidovorax lacteus]